MTKTKKTTITNARAAGAMVCVDLDNPKHVAFVNEQVLPLRDTAQGPMVELTEEQYQAWRNVQYS